MDIFGFGNGGYGGAKRTVRNLAPEPHPPNASYVTRLQLC